MLPIPQHILNILLSPLRCRRGQQTMRLTMLPIAFSDVYMGEIMTDLMKGQTKLAAFQLLYVSE